jgi:hypothetical protein
MLRGRQSGDRSLRYQRGHRLGRPRVLRRRRRSARHRAVEDRRHAGWDRPRERTSAREPMRPTRIRSSTWGGPVPLRFHQPLRCNCVLVDALPVRHRRDRSRDRGGAVRPVVPGLRRVVAESRDGLDRPTQFMSDDGIHGFELWRAMARTLEPPWSGRCAVVLMDRCRTTWGLALRRGRRRQAQRRAVAQRRDEDGHRRWFGTSCREGETRSVSRAGPGSVSGSRRSARRSTSRPMTAGTALSRGGATRPRGACSCSDALVEARMVRSPSGLGHPPR